MVAAFFASEGWLAMALGREPGSGDQVSFFSTERASPAPLAWLLLFLLGLTWGGSFLGIAKALTGFGPLTIAATRIGIAAVILSGVALASGKGLPPQSTPVGRRIWLHCLGMGVSPTPFHLRCLPGGRSR
jgi:hypothetical protein